MGQARYRCNQMTAEIRLCDCLRHDFPAVFQVLKIVSKFVPGTGGVGTKTELFNVPYSLSEDFVSSYRMHPLIPDEFTVDGDKVRHGQVHSPLFIHTK